MSATRVAMTPIGGAGWLGGRNYQLNLLRALAEHQAGRVQPVVFCGDDLPAGEFQQFASIPGVDVIRSPVFSKNKASCRLLRALALGRDALALDEFVRHGISVVFESAVFFGWRNPLPTIAWFPDFQHRRMRELFGAAAFWKRELGFRIQVGAGRRLMLSSEDARTDCERFYAGAAGRTEVVRFAAPIEPELIVDDPWAAMQRYALPPGFMFLPNQFWRHKNHAIVIEALALLRGEGLDITIAASGNTHDPRRPGHFAELRQRVDALGLGESFRVLGVIPRGDLVSLLRTCRGLINPSLFEGWSSTVEEARALGVPMILSDIPVHREQMGGAAAYFGTGDARGLADHLKRALVTCPAPTTPRSVREDSFDHVRRFADDFAAAVNRAAQGFSPTDSSQRKS